MKRGLLAAVLLTAFAPPRQARAAPASGEEDVGGTLEELVPEKPLGVIQNRKFRLLHEVVLLGGGLPVDPFYKGITVTGGYSLHFSDILAWDVIHFTYSFNIDTELKNNLIKTAIGYGNQTPDFPEIEWIAASHLVLKPLYGKEAIFNTKVVHLEGYVMAGPAFVRRSALNNTFAYGVDTGFGVRLWLETWLSLRLDFVELIYFLDVKPQQALHMHLGVAFNLRGED